VGADGSYVRLLTRFARADVLVLDEWAMAPITDAERRDLNVCMATSSASSPR
jgi:DNA replication protein DnaC